MYKRYIHPDYMFRIKQIYVLRELFNNRLPRGLVEFCSDLVELCLFYNRLPRGLVEFCSDLFELCLLYNSLPRSLVELFSDLFELCFDQVRTKLYYASW
jgi:hypothetical protein